jgi:hypothetical protein
MIPAALFRRIKNARLVGRAIVFLFKGCACRGGQGSKAFNIVSVAPEPFKTVFVSKLI